jgi:hypothetical protein
VRCLQRPTFVGREHEIEVLPRRTSGETLLELTRAMRAQRPHDGIRQRERSARSRRLRLEQLQAVSGNAHECVRDVERAHVEVDVLPAEAERLALAKAEGEGNGIERLQAIAAGSLEERPGFGDRQKARLELWDARRICGGIRPRRSRTMRSSPRMPRSSARARSSVRPTSSSRTCG